MSRSLAIAMLSHVASPNAPTGAERSLAVLAGELRRRGHRVRVFAPGPWSLSEELRERGVETAEIACRCCWLTYYHPRSRSETALRWARFAWPDPGGARLARALRGGEFDLAHVNCLPHLRGAAAARIAGLPVVWHLREILPPGARRRWFSRQVARHATRVVAVSEAVGRWVREDGPADRLEVIPNGAAEPAEAPERDVARRALGLPGDGCVIGLFGQLVPHKGPLEFVRAARIASARQDGLRFVIAGSGPERFVDRLREALRGEGSDDRILLLDAQPSAEGLIAAADAVCLATTTPDPFPRSVLEAMAGGRPVVAFRSGGATEMVVDGETGLLVASGDVQGLADAFARIGSDPTLRRRMGERGRERARSRFSLESHVNRMEALFCRVASR